jgi:hypothetical protein
MISSACEIREFVECVKDKSYWDMLTLLIDETTEAERMLYSRKTIHTSKHLKSKTYARVLKEFITFLRHGVLSSKLSSEDVQLFISVYMSLLERKESGVPLRSLPDQH